MRVIKKCAYGTEHDRQYISIYIPDSNHAVIDVHPIIIWYHQGTYNEGGDRPEVLNLVDAFVPSGYVFIAAEYYTGKEEPSNWSERLAVMRKAIKDMMLTFNNVYNYVDVLGGSTDYIFVASESWGAMYLNWLVFADKGDVGPCLGHDKILDGTPIGLISLWGGLPGQTGILIAEIGGTGYEYMQGNDPPDMLWMHNRHDDTIDDDAATYFDVSYQDIGKNVYTNIWAYRVDDPTNTSHRMWDHPWGYVLGRMAEWTEEKIATYPGPMSMQDPPLRAVPVWPP